MNEDIKNKMKITLEQDHPNAYSTIRDDLEKIHDKNVYWTDIEDVNPEFFDDPLHNQIVEIQTRIKALEEFFGANYEKDENGNFINNPFDLRITRTELGLMRRPIIDSHIPEFEAESDEIPSPEERLFELEKRFQYLQEEGLTDKINELNSIIEQLKRLEEDIKFEANIEQEIKDARVTLSGETKNTLNERLDEDFRKISELINDVNYFEKEGYVIHQDKSIPGKTKDLHIYGRTDYNLVQGDTNESQFLPVTPDGISNKPIRKLEFSRGNAVFVKSIQGYTYESLINDEKFAGDEHKSEHTPPRSTSYTIEDTEQGETVTMKSIDGATLLDVTTSKFPEDGIIMPFLPSDGVYSILDNEEEGSVSLGKVKGRSVKNEIITGITDSITVGSKPEDSATPVSLDEKTEFSVNSVMGRMIENSIVGDSRSVSKMPVYDDLKEDDTVYIDGIDGKTVIDILATCDTTPLQIETTTLLDVKKTLLENERIFVKEGRFRELSIHGRTLNNLGLTPKKEKLIVFSNSISPIDVLEDKEPTEITEIKVKGKTYNNVLNNIGQTELIESIDSELNLYDLFVNEKYGINVALDTESYPTDINIIGNENNKSEFIELRSYRKDDSYESVHTITPLKLSSNDKMHLTLDENKYEVERSGSIVSSGHLYSKDDVLFYSIKEDGQPYKLPDGTRNVYNTSEQAESIYIKEIELNGTEIWKLKTIAQNKINSTVFNYDLPSNVVLPSSNSIMANFDFDSDEKKYFKKSVAGNEGTNKYEDEAISITNKGQVEIRISFDRMGGNKLEDFCNYLSKHPITIRVQLEYPETTKVPYGEKIIKKYDFQPTLPTNFRIYDGYKFELVSNNICKISMTLPTYNRYTVNNGIYTVVTRKGNYVNEVDCSTRGNYLVNVKDKAIYVDTKEPQIMLLKGDLEGDSVIQSLSYEEISLSPSYNKGRNPISIYIGDTKLPVTSSQLAEGASVTFSLIDENIMTDTEIRIEGNEDELAQLEFTYNSLHKFNSNIDVSDNGLTEYTAVDVLEDGTVNRKELFVAKDITAEQDGLLFITEQMMHNPMLFEGNYMKDHFGNYFEGVKSVTLPCELRGFGSKYCDSYNYNTKVLTRYTDILVLSEPDNCETWSNGVKINIYRDGVSSNWFDNRSLNTIASPNADVVYLDKDHIGIKTSETLAQFKERIAEEPIEVYFALLKPVEISKEDLDKLDSQKLDPRYEDMFSYNGEIIKVDSIVPPTFKYKTRSHNYFENVNIEEKEYIMTSEFDGEGFISICGIPISIDSIDKQKIDLRGTDLTENNKVIRTSGFNNIYGLSIYEANDSFLYGLDDVTSIGDTGSIDIFTIGKNKINIHDFSDKAENDLLYIDKKESSMSIRVDILEDKEYTYSFNVLNGSGLIKIKLDGFNMSEDYFKFEEGIFEFHISDTNMVEIEIITKEDNVVIVDMQLEEGNDITEFESYYKSGYSIKLDEPLMSYNNDCKDSIKIGVDDYKAIIERNVGCIIIDNWEEDGDNFRHTLDLNLIEYKCNYMKDTVVKLQNNNSLIIPKEIFITLDLEQQPVQIIYPLQKTIKEIVDISPIQ